MENPIDATTAYFNILAEAVAEEFDFNKVNVLKNGVHKIHNPWDSIDIPKKTRKGKSFEEIQELRRLIYESKKQ